MPRESLSGAPARLWSLKDPGGLISSKSIFAYLLESGGCLFKIAGGPCPKLRRGPRTITEPVSCESDSRSHDMQLLLWLVAHERLGVPVRFTGGAPKTSGRQFVICEQS